MKNTLLALTLSGLISTGYAQINIEPLPQVISRLSKTNPDLSEMAYIGLRCGALYNMIAGYLEANGSPSDASTVSSMKKGAQEFNLVGIALNSTANKMSKEAMLQQGKSLSSHYGRLMSDGKRMNNNALTSTVMTDLAACKSELTAYSTIAKEMRSR